MNIVTTGTEAQEYTIESGNIIAANLTRVEAEIKVNSAAGPATFPGQVIRIQDGTVDLNIMFTTTDIFLLDNTATAISIFTGDMTINRIVRIELNSTSGAEIFVDGNSEHIQAYAGIFAGVGNDLTIGDYAASSTNLNGDVDWDYLYYNLDVVSNPGGTDWVIDGDFVSQEVTITGPFTALDTQTILPKPTNASQLTWVNTKLRLNVDRINDTTIKLFALEANDEAFNFEFDIIKTDAGIT